MDNHKYIAEYGNESAWNVTIIVIIIVLMIFVVLQVASASFIDSIWYMPLKYIKKFIKEFQDRHEHTFWDDTVEEELKMRPLKKN
jgi:hypothetical protein